MAFVDRITPVFWPAATTSQLETARIRTLTTVCWFMAALAVGVFLLIRDDVVTSESATHAYTMVYFVLAFVAFPIAIALGMRFKLAAYAFASYAVVVLTFQCTQLGGLVTIKAMLFVPVATVSAFILGWRGGIFIGLLVISAISYLFFSLGIEHYNFYVETMTTTELIDSFVFNVFVGLVLAIIIAISGAALYNIEINRALTALAIARKEAEEANRSKSEFLANMSHEIRTPMNGVVGMAEILQTSELPERERGFADTIHKSGLALLTIVNDILDFSKIEAGKLELDPAPFDLHDAIDDVATLLGSAAREKKIDLIVRYRPDTPRKVVGDAGRLRQALTNLIGNAIKFTHEGGVFVTVTGTETGNHANLRINVEDTGIGIPEETASRIFDKFTQAESSTTRRFGGTGLGLSITKSLINAMGGDIGVESQLGEGSTFWIDLTLEVDTYTTTTDHEPALTEGSLAGRHVLIVDDLDVNRDIFSEIFTALGMVPHCAASVKQGLALLRTETGQNIDVVVTDYQMPDLDGLALATTIRKKQNTDLPILVLSSVDSDATRNAFTDLEDVEFLTKPARSTEIEKAVVSLLKLPSANNSERHQAHSLGKTGAEIDTATVDKERILIAEDNQVNQLVIENMIDHDRFSLHFANNGKQALALLKATPFDLVFMDISMPVMDGETALKAIKAYEHAEKRDPVPVVALTAHAMEGDHGRFIAMGFDDYLSKPVRKAAINRVLEKFFSGEEEADQAEPIVGEIENDRAVS
ncbi:MAG: response regulator [Pseudomonadota bacterium]